MTSNDFEAKVRQIDLWAPFSWNVFERKKSRNVVWNEEESSNELIELNGESWNLAEFEPGFNRQENLN